MHLRRTLSLLVLTGAIAVLNGQNTGTITGIATDPSGAAIPNVKVLVVQLDTNFESRAVTNAEGLYRVQSLQPGTYSVTFESGGFKRMIRDNIILRVGDVMPVDAAMQIGTTTESIEVKAESVLLETDYQRERDTIYARWELVEKSGHELVLAPVDLEKIFTVNAISLGYVRDLSHGDGVDVGIGGQFTLDFWPGGLDRYYGDGPGYGFQVFLRLRPSRHDHAAH